MPLLMRGLRWLKKFQIHIKENLSENEKWIIREKIVSYNEELEMRPYRHRELLRYVLLERSRLIR